MTRVMREDFACVARDAAVDWQAFEGKTVVVSGATGLIGTTLVGSMLEHERTRPTGMRVVALVRNEHKLHDRLGEPACLIAVPWDAADPSRGLEQVRDADYVFHCACVTDSAAFVERPLDVLRTTMGSTQALLELGRATGAKVVVLSTMETYGEVDTNDAIREDEGGFLDAMVVRNSYPEAKRACEALCAAFVAQEGVDACVARLSQTFGPGVAPDDRRVFAYFARQALRGEDIVLQTEGTKQNSYLYTADAATALLCLAAHGQAGRAYNVANDATFCSVRYMAQLVAYTFGRGRMSVRIELDPVAARRFRKGDYLRLDTRAIEELGWQPRVGLADMYAHLMSDWREAGGGGSRAGRTVTADNRPPRRVGPPSASSTAATVPQERSGAGDCRPSLCACPAAVPQTDARDAGQVAGGVAGKVTVEGEAHAS